MFSFLTPWLAALAGGSSQRVLGPAVAGSWYPGTRSSLDGLLAEMLGRIAPAPASGRVLAIVAPHAGYVYSGQVAAAGFARLRGSAPDRVVLIGPSHYAGFRGAAVPDADLYRTPLGELPLDRAALDELAGSPAFRSTNEPFRPEHSLEMELPFLQKVLEPGWKLVPVLVGGATDSGGTAEIASALRRLLGPRTLVVVSSDFTHYGPRFGYVPFRDSLPERLSDLDRGAIRFIEARDPDGFEGYVSRTGATICGHNPIEVLLRLLPGGVQVETAAYDTSGRITGEWDNTVSYASVVVFEPGPAEVRVPTAEKDATAETTSPRSRNRDGSTGSTIPTTIPDAPMPAAVPRTEAERSWLIALARTAIADRLLDDGSLDRFLKSGAIPDSAREPGACFVTLKEEGDLRGCIGSLRAEQPLYQDVIRNARSAAFRDPRFPALRLDELPRITIGISILTPSRPIADMSEIVPGRHGVELQAGLHRSVFLPQVASEQGWGVEELLGNLARKAGLPRDAWRDAELKVFEAESFGEE